METARKVLNFAQNRLKLEQIRAKTTTWKERLIDNLEDSDDVQNVWTNWDN